MWAQKSSSILLLQDGPFSHPASLYPLTVPAGGPNGMNGIGRKCPPPTPFSPPCSVIGRDGRLPPMIRPSPEMVPGKWLSYTSVMLCSPGYLHLISVWGRCLRGNSYVAALVLTKAFKLRTLLFAQATQKKHGTKPLWLDPGVTCLVLYRREFKVDMWCACLLVGLFLLQHKLTNIPHPALCIYQPQRAGSPDKTLIPVGYLNTRSVFGPVQRCRDGRRSGNKGQISISTRIF